MDEKDSKPRVVTGEVVPRERVSQQLPHPNAPAGIPVIVQAKYWAARRKLESYTKALVAQTAAFRALGDRERARQDFEVTLIRTEHLDDLRRIEELKIIDELAALVEASEVRGFRTRTVKAHTEAEAIEAERRLEAIKKPAASEQKNERSAAQQAGFDITQMRKDAEELKKTLIEICGGEDKLTQEDHDLLEQVDVAIRNKVVDRLENF